MIFKYKRTILSFFVILAIAFTWLIAHINCPGVWATAFWYKMSGLWIGELLLGAMIVIVGKNSGRALPFHMGNIAVAVLHLIAVGLLFALTCSAAGVLLWEIGILLAALFLHTLCAFAQQITGDDPAAVRKSFNLRNELLATLEMFEVSNREVIGDDAQLAAAFGKLKDAANFASDSVPGCEELDAGIRAALADLGKCTEAAAMTRAADDLTARIGARQNMLKRLR